MLDNTYKITTDKITFHIPLVRRLVLFMMGAIFCAAMCWCGTVGLTSQSGLTRAGVGQDILFIFLLLPFMALGILIARCAFRILGYLDLKKMSYEGFSYGWFSDRKITVPRQEMRSVIVLYRERHNIHNIVIVCSRPISQLPVYENPDHVNYIFLILSYNRPEAEYLAQRVADCLSLPYFGIMDRRRG